MPSGVAVLPGLETQRRLQKPSKCRTLSVGQLFKPKVDLRVAVVSESEQVFPISPGVQNLWWQTGGAKEVGMPFEPSAPFTSI
jgi:hypothetical protein